MRNEKLLRNIDRATCDTFYRQYEHLGNVGLGVWHYGLFVQGLLNSAVSFGPTSFNPKRFWLSKLICPKTTKLIQLCRGATLPTAPKNTPSHIISRSMRDLRNRIGPFIAIAYSDPMYGEVGSIYQACGAIYCGITNPKHQANYEIDGKLVSGWVVRKKYGTRDKKKLIKILGNNFKVIPLKPKHVYLLLGCSKAKKKLIDQILDPHKKQYPKRSTEGIKSMVELGYVERTENDARAL